MSRHVLETDQPNSQRRHRARKRWLGIHAAAFAVVNVFFVSYWLLIRSDQSLDVPQRLRDSPWPIYQMLAWGLILGIHSIYVWSRKPVDPVRAPGGERRRAVRTIVFTDIVGSTELAARLGDARWTELLASHDLTAERLTRRFGGEIAKQTGDGLVVTFDRPAPAVLFADTLRMQLEAQGLRIRAGIHAGEVDLRGRDIAGIGVHLASRVMAAAEPSEILASRTVRDLAGGSGIGFIERGPREFKGIDGRWEVYAVDVGQDGHRTLER